MGWQPKPRTERVKNGRFLFWTLYKDVPIKALTYLDEAKRKFVNGEFDTETFERRVMTLFTTGLAEKPVPMKPPPRPKGMPPKPELRKLPPPSGLDHVSTSGTIKGFGKKHLDKYYEDNPPETDAEWQDAQDRYARAGYKLPNRLSMIHPMDEPYPVMVL